jgi:hypothetical protein
VLTNTIVKKVEGKEMIVEDEATLHSKRIPSDKVLIAF